MRQAIGSQRVEQNWVTELKNLHLRQKPLDDAERWYGDHKLRITVSKIHTEIFTDVIIWYLRFVSRRPGKQSKEWVRECTVKGKPWVGICGYWRLKHEYSLYSSVYFYMLVIFCSESFKEGIKKGKKTTNMK